MEGMGQSKTGTGKDRKEGSPALDWIPALPQTWFPEVDSNLEICIWEVFWK
jgi:hypothetical protein